MYSSDEQHSTEDVVKLPQPTEKNVTENEYEDAEKNYQPKTLKFWVIVIGMLSSVFLVALDRMIIATAIPAITDEFHSIADIGWYGSAYSLTTGIFNPLFGRIYKLYPTKWVFLISILIFEVGSALCGAAPSSAALIAGRAIAGVGAAGIFCGGIMIIIPLVPLRKRPVFNSFFGMVFGVSSVIGPVVGGSFTDNRHLTWRWCFYINLPIGAFTFFSVLLFFNLESQPRKKLSIFEQIKGLDPIGLFFLIPSMVCFVLALQWGGTTYPWSAPRIIGLLVAFAVLFVIFVAVEFLTPETSMAPSRVVLNRSVGGSLLFTFLLAGGMMTILYYLTIWFQAAQGQTAMEAGVRTIPLVISLVVMGIAAAVFTQKVGYYVPPMLLSPVMSAVGSGLLSTLTPASPSAHWIGYQLLYGLGIGAGLQPSNLVPQHVLPRTDVPLGLALNMFMQQMGGSIFLAVAQNIFSSRLVDGLEGIAGLDPEAIINTGATALRSAVPPEYLSVVLNAYSYALTRVFILAAALSAATILAAGMIKWKSIKGGKSGHENTDKANEEGKSETQS